MATAVCYERRSAPTEASRRSPTLCHCGGERVLGAANLLLPLVQFIDSRDSRMQTTLETTQRALVFNGLVYRYVDAADGLPGEEAAFAAYTF